MSLWKKPNIFSQVQFVFNLVIIPKKSLFFFSGCTNSYGENCQYLCHPLCANQTCDQFDGTCAIASKIGIHGKEW